MLGALKGVQRPSNGNSGIRSTAEAESKACRHTGESRYPGLHARTPRLWIPAFAGMTVLMWPCFWWAVAVAFDVAVDVIPPACRRASQRSERDDRHGCRSSAARPWMACRRGAPESARSTGDRLAPLLLASRRNAAGRIPLVTFLGRSRKVTRAIARNSSVKPNALGMRATPNPSGCAMKLLSRPTG